MKFAFIIMGDFFDYKRDYSTIHNGLAQIIGVSSIKEACAVATELYNQGIDCIELCGAFEESGAKKVIEATSNEIPIGYVTHLSRQDRLFELKFNK